MTKDERKEYMKQWRKTNKEKIYSSYKKWSSVNRKDRYESNKKYRDKNKEKLKEINRNYRLNNREEIAKTKRKYEKNNKYIFVWRGVLKCYLKRLNRGKIGKTIDLLGYSALDLKNHITILFTDGMSWDNYGEWHIDHIKRVSEFDKETHPSIVNALSNLRPLWATTREINGVVYEGNLNRSKK